MTESYVLKVGIERELWLVQKDTGKLVEPAIHGFPHDEFGFLVELRSEPFMQEENLLRDISEKMRRLMERADSVGCLLLDSATMPLDPDFIRELSAKYEYDTLADLTKNIYPETRGSHYSGIEEGNVGTAGIHVHFSKHRISDLGVEELDVEGIVKGMDGHFKKVVTKAGRRLGEWEPKEHGFEYRGLPSSAPLEEVVRVSFQILREMEEKEGRGEPE